MSLAHLRHAVRSIGAVALPCAALAAAVVLLTPAVATASPASHARPARPAVDPLAIVALQQAELHASVPSSYAQFGNAVALSGTTALVGAREETVDGNEEAGAAYVFVRTGALWKLQQRLVATDPGGGDGFGLAVALSGDTALIGAPGRMVAGQSVAGAAFVFVRSGDTWTQQAELHEPGPSTSDQFGVSVALSGATALIGANGVGVGGYASAGAAYLFEGSGTAWTEQAQLTAPASDLAANANFGWAVALDGDTALVGAPFGSLGSPHGAAYLFAGSGATWTMQERFVAFDPADNDSFGWDVALSGDTALVGAPGINKAGQDSAGAAYVFAGPGWTPQAELQGADEVANDEFGSSLALSGTRALIGAPGESDLGPILPARARRVAAARVRATSGHGAGGVAYVFDGAGTKWSPQRELAASDGAAYDCFGQSVALSGTAAMIGSLDKKVGAADHAGAVYAESFAKPTLTLKAAPRAVKVGKTVALSGVVRNFVSSTATVRLYRKVGARLTLLKTVKLSGSGAFSWGLKPRQAGDWVLLAAYRAGGLTFKSRTLTVAVNK
jgi:hypothetical protein